MRVIAAGVAASVLLAGCKVETTRSAGAELPPYFRSAETLNAHGRVTILLDMWHRAAARGDFDAYFSRMTDDAVFLGTDPDERWTRAEFEAFARPYFNGVEAWTYEPIERHIIVEPRDDPAIAWFDEILSNEKYGRCRGTGVAVRGGDGEWRLAHYSLTLLVPNEVTSDVVAVIRSAE